LYACHQPASVAKVGGPYAWDFGAGTQGAEINPTLSAAHASAPGAVEFGDHQLRVRSSQRIAGVALMP